VGFLGHSNHFMAVSWNELAAFKLVTRWSGRSGCIIPAPLSRWVRLVLSRARAGSRNQ
jgi:hypothetical protein